MTSLLPLLLAASLSAAPAAQAPDFSVSTVFNAPVSKLSGLEELKGKVVFLEFWATWCAPCVAGIPRTNRLIEKLAGEPVVFLMVTDEPASMIEAWLKKREVKSWVGADPAASALKAYKVHGRPDGYLIGKDGALLARVFPDSLAEKDVRDALAGTFKPRPVTWGDKHAPKSEARAGAAPLYEAVILPASSEFYMSRGDDRLEARGLPFAVTIAWLWDVESEQVEAEDPPVKSFDFRLRTPQAGFEQGRAQLQAAVQSTFDVTVVRERRVVDAFALALSGSVRPKAGAAEGKHGIMAKGGGRLLGTATMAEFAKGLWMSVNKPVVDETGLSGVYELDLEWDPEDPAARARALEAAGLKLVPAKREVEFLRVVRAKKP